jgi:hypothetical protein
MLRLAVLVGVDLLCHGQPGVAEDQLRIAGRDAQILRQPSSRTPTRPTINHPNQTRPKRQSSSNFPYYIKTDTASSVSRPCSQSFSDPVGANPNALYSWQAGAFVRLTHRVTRFPPSRRAHAR